MVSDTPDKFGRAAGDVPLRPGDRPGESPDVGGRHTTERGDPFGSETAQLVAQRLHAGDMRGDPAEVGGDEVLARMQGR